MVPNTIISVVIPARNEEKKIGALLTSLEKQSYPSHLFEIIVVDDFSDDATATIVARFKNVRLLPLEKFVDKKINSYKKKAIEVAISVAKGDLIVTTDADCIVSPEWLSNVAWYYQKTHHQFFTMPVMFSPVNNLLNIFQSLDFMVLQGITGASARTGTLSMANGANLAYTKAAFLTVGGFTGIDTIASGDDMLLMHKIEKAFPGKTGYLKSAGVIVETEAMPTIKAFLNQRIRWASKADKYDDKRNFLVLLLVFLLNVALCMLPCLALFSQSWSLLRLWIYFVLIKTLVEMIFLWPVAKFFKQQSLLWWFPMMQPFHIIYTVLAGIFGKFGKYEWKGRKVS